MGEIAPLRSGYAFKSDDFKKTGIPVLRISNIQDNGRVGGVFVYHNEIANDNDYTLPQGSIVLAMSGATTGKVAILYSNHYNKIYQNQRVGYFQNIKKSNYLFISTLVRSNSFMNKIKSSIVSGAQPNISSRDVNFFIFEVPFALDEQEMIGKLFNNFDESIAIHQRKPLADLFNIFS